MTRPSHILFLAPLRQPDGLTLTLELDLCALLCHRFADPPRHTARLQIPVQRHDILTHDLGEQRRRPHKVDQPSTPIPVRRTADKPTQPRLAPQCLAHNLLRVGIRRESAVLLTKRQPPLEDVVDGLVETRARQRTMGPGCEVGFDGAGHGYHYANAEGFEFEAEGAGPDVDGALGGGVDCAKEVGDLCGRRRDVEDKASGIDQKRDEGIDNPHRTKDIGVISLLHILDISINSRNHMGTTANTPSASVTSWQPHRNLRIVDNNIK